MKMSEETKQKLIAAGREDLIKVFEINQSGYAGCDRKGTIVDRRENPDAVPVHENSLFGIPPAQKLPNEPHPEYFE